MSKIIKNFLPKSLLKQIITLITSDSFPWYVHTFVTFENSKEKEIYFTHILYNEDRINSSSYNLILSPFIKKIKFKKLIKAKLNLYPISQKKIEHQWHTDKSYPHKVALFYLNTNNGFTLFKNPYKKIKSESNKCIIFDGLQEHKSTTCTDKKFRLTLNINYE
tara:strand:- start:1172 stop:1660 length:489 start_codon:yes stop_codon:yes gene_type:complete